MFGINSWSFRLNKVMQNMYTLLILNCSKNVSLKYLGVLVRP